MPDHRLVSALATDGRRVAQDDQTTDEEHKRDLRGEGQLNYTAMKVQVGSFDLMSNQALQEIIVTFLICPLFQILPLQ